MTPFTTAEKTTLKTQLQTAGDYLGMLQQNPAEWLGFSGDSSENNADIEVLIQARNNARNEKDYAKADEIRDTLKSMNIEIEDSPTGTQWRRL